MKLTKEEKQEIAQMVVETLDQRGGFKINPNWTDLSKDVKTIFTVVAGTHCNQKIFGAIRAALNISQVKYMTDEQVTEAHEVFEFIKQEREKAK